MTTIRSIGGAIIDAILHGATNEEAIGKALAFDPDAKTTEKSVSWYRTRLKSAGARVPSAREAPGFDENHKPPKPRPVNEGSALQRARGVICEVIAEKGTNEQAFREAVEKFPDSGIRKREVTDLRHVLLPWKGDEVLTDKQARKFQGEDGSDLSHNHLEKLSDDDRERCKVLLDELRDILAI